MCSATICDTDRNSCTKDFIGNVWRLNITVSYTSVDLDFQPSVNIKNLCVNCTLATIPRNVPARTKQHRTPPTYRVSYNGAALRVDTNGNIEPSIWYDGPGIGFAGKGTAYIEQAFRWARAADPKALLFYNDYDTEGVNPKSDAVYAMVKDFKKRGVPIDGVGIQAHIFNLDMKEISSLAANLARLTALGVQVHFTEMDVAVPLTANGVPLDQADLARQADIYRFVAKACLQQRGCTAFQTWGFTDKYSWIPGYTKGAKGRALLFDQKYLPKPAYNALREVLEQQAQRVDRRSTP